MSPVVTEVYGRAEYNLFEFNTGLVLKYSLKNIESLIKDDEDLYREFKAIRRSKNRKNKMYLYIEKYNSRNPLPQST